MGGWVGVMYETRDKDLIALGLWPVLSAVLSHLPCLSPEPSVRVVSRQKDAELGAPRRALLQASTGTTAPFSHVVPAHPHFSLPVSL